jgi:hypothetical protein
VDRVSGDPIIASTPSAVALRSPSVSVEENQGAGLVVEGNGNTVTDTNAFSTNIVKKSRSGDKSGKGNGGNGILVSGAATARPAPSNWKRTSSKPTGWWESA